MGRVTATVIKEKIDNRIKDYSKLKTVNKIRQIKRSKRNLKTIYVTSNNKCCLCKETRLLEKAHIIPMSLWSDMDNKIKVPEPFQYVMSLCPTHHRCYDNFMLNESEKQLIASIINADCLYAFEALLECSHGYVGVDNKLLNNFLDLSWKWWRNYYART